MTGRARHHALTHRMAIGFIDLDNFFGVTTLTDFHFTDLVQNFVSRSVDAVARATADIFGSMGAALPIYMVALVACQADFTLHLDRKIGAGVKTQTGNFQWELRVFLSRTVAGFAGMIDGSAAHIGRDKMRATQDARYRAIVVTFQTGFFPVFCVGQKRF